MCESCFKYFKSNNFAFLLFSNKSIMRCLFFRDEFRMSLLNIQIMLKIQFTK
jgi:hypothetical protein